MKTVNYTEIVSKAQKGIFLIGIEPAKARKFFTNTDMKALEPEIGQSLSKQSLTINAMMIFGWISMFSLGLISIFTFKWWSLAIIPGVFIIYMFYQSIASLARQRLWGVLLFMTLCFFLSYQFNGMGKAVSVFFIVLPFPFLFVRLMYYLSCKMLRSLCLDNENIFNLLYEKIIFIKED